LTANTTCRLKNPVRLDAHTLCFWIWILGSSANSHRFLRKQYCFVAKQYCFVKKQHYFAEKPNRFSARKSFWINRVATRVSLQHCLDTKQYCIGPEKDCIKTKQDCFVPMQYCFLEKRHCFGVIPHWPFPKSCWFLAKPLDFPINRYCRGPETPYPALETPVSRAQPTVWNATGFFPATHRRTGKHNKGPHEKWTNGKDSKAIPRHKEINEFTALGIISFAEKNPPEPKERKK